MKSEIVAKIKALAEQEFVSESSTEFNELVNEFYKIQDEEEREWEIEKLARIEAGESEESIEKPVFSMLNELMFFQLSLKKKES